LALESLQTMQVGVAIWCPLVDVKVLTES
jgi:hypothetical protein